MQPKLYPLFNQHVIINLNINTQPALDNLLNLHIVLSEANACLTQSHRPAFMHRTHVIK